MVNIAQLLSLPTLRRDLDRVDDALRKTVLCDDPFLSEVAAHLILAGGKRLRPSLAIASALMTSDGPVSDSVIKGAAAVELVHLGSLYHDDVLDGAKTRRTVASANARYGNFMAIVAGDYLLAKASGIAAELGTEATALLATTISELCQGQVWEQRFAYDIDRTVEAYNMCIAGKTASLIAASSRIGAVTSGSNVQTIDALTEFAHAFGMAFQVRDDVLDVVGTSEQLGKPAGNDLMEGVYTLPVILALANDPNNELRSILGGPIDTAQRDRARELIQRSGGVEAAVKEGSMWARRAIDCLQVIPDTNMSRDFTELSSALFDDLDFAPGAGAPRTIDQ